MTKASPNPDEFLPLTSTEYQIMLVLAEAERHGYGIMQAIETQTNGQMQIGPGTLYTTIKRLLERAWIEEVDAPASADDPRRKYYRLTGFGERIVRLESLRLEVLVRTARNLGLLEQGT